jgi:hypothetical protein
MRQAPLVGDLILMQNNYILYYNATIKHLGKYSHGNKTLRNQKQRVLFHLASPPITGTAATRYSGSKNIQTVDVVNVGYMLQDQTQRQGLQTYNMEGAPITLQPLILEDDM